MTFPPEVASFMALADKDHPPPAGLSLDGGSSAAAAEVFGSASGSAGGLVASWAGHERSQSPIIEQDELGPHLDTQRLSQDTVTSRPTASPVGGGVRESIESSFVSPTALSDTTAVPQLQSQSQPEHVQFTPAMLPWTTLTIPSTSVFPDKNKHELLAFIIAVKITSPALSWTVGKTLSAFNELDSNAQKYTNMSKKEWRKVVGPLPDGKAWKDLAPGKIDQRKMQCETFLQKMLTVGMNDKGNDELHRFLTTDVIQRKTDHIKEGYLTKRGQKFGGWKTRYFVLDQSVMKYYETRGGALMGSIQIKGAQVGSQVPSRRNDRSTSDDEVYKYAILIKDGRDNHILCASTIAERDHWIEALVAATEAPAPSPPTSSSDKPPMAAGLGHQRRRSAIRAKASKDVIVTSAQPMSQLADANAKFISGAPLPSMINKMENDRQHPPGGGNNSTLHLVHLPPPSDQHHSDAATPKPIKRQSALPGRQSFSPAYLSKLSSDGLSVVPGYNLDRERKAKSGRFWGFGKAPERGALRPVFGVPLADSIAIASVASLPAIVFRCIEYLEAKRAEQEEGIYRLSGSSTVIKGLKERFNHEGDVNLLQLDERWDPHAIAGLLKTYLRELPTPLLTRELHMRFLAVIGENENTTT
jgi:RalA-binding protein 1